MTSRRKLAMRHSGYGLLHGMVSWWGLNEGAGTRYDERKANHLTDNNTVGVAAGYVNQTASHFASASSEYLSHADSASLSLATGDWTIAGWFRPQGLGADWAVVSKYTTTGNDRGYLLGYQNSVNRFRLVVSPDGTSGTTQATANNFGDPNNGDWVFLLAYHDAGSVIGIQVDNGTADETSYVTGSIYDTAAVFTLSGINVNTTFKFNGTMEQVAIWSRLLTPHEKFWLYNQGGGRRYWEVVGTN